MIKLSHTEQIKFARYVGIAAALFEHGYSEESIKLALEQSMPEGIVKEAFWGAAGRGALRLGKWLIRGAKGARGARMAGKAIKPGAKSFNLFEGLRRGVGMDLTRWGAKPGKAAWETAKSKSTIGKGIGTGLFAKSMLGGMGGGSAPPPQPSTYGY